jgi:hypothetical protein
MVVLFVDCVAVGAAMGCHYLWIVLA